MSTSSACIRAPSTRLPSSAMGGDGTNAANDSPWRRRRRPSTASSILRSRGRSGSSPSASGQSTCIGSIPTWASSSRSSSRRCCSATSAPVAVGSTPSPAPGRRSWPGARVGHRRRRRHLRVQRAPDLGQDARARSRAARGRRRRGRAGRLGESGERPRASSASGSRRRPPPSCFTSAR